MDWMNCKKIMRSLLVAGMALSMTMSQAMAKDSSLQISWYPEVYTMHAGQDNLLSNNARQQIKDAISARLKDLAAAGKLPFTVKQGASGSLSNVQESFSDDVPLSLLPIVVVDESFDTHITIGDTSAWRHVIASGLNIAICSAGTADDAGMKMLAVVPLSGYTVIGDPNENGGKIMPKALTDSQKSNAYAALSVAMIKDMDFNTVAKALKNWQRDKVSPVTTQVADVKISSKKAQGIFHGHGVQLRNLIANVYSAEYQKATGNLVMPPRISAAFQQQAQKNMYAFEMHCPSGKVMMSMGEPGKTVVLDFSGAAEAEVTGKKASNIRKDILYKAWLKKTTDDGKEVVLDDYMVEPQFKKAGSNIEVDKKDIYARLEMKLAKKMAAQKR